MTKHSKNIYWPESSQKELLQAVFLSGVTGLSAFERWKAQIDMSDHPDIGSFRLLPLLFHQLKTQGIDDPLLMKLKGVARRNWYQNQRYFQSIAPLLQAFHQIGVNFILLYEPALALHYYTEYALESEIDLPVLVPFSQVKKAMHQVQLMGWQPVGRLPEAMLDRYLAATWRHLFHDGLGHRIHLHWQFLPSCRTAEFEATIWESTIETKIHEVPVHILNPADQLLHSCIAGDSLIPKPNFVRAVDAMIITKNFPDLDWNRLLNQASEIRLIVPLSIVLGYLQDILNEPFPPAFWQQLSSIPISDQDFLEYKLITSRPQLWSRFWQIWLDYRRQTATGSIFIDLIGFPQHLQDYWRLSKPSQIPGQALSVVRRRLRIHRGRESLAESPKL